MAARRKTRGGSDESTPEKRPRLKQTSAPEPKAPKAPKAFWPRDARGRFVPLADYRPRDDRGRYVPTAKIPKRVQKLVEDARARRRVAEREAEERAARERSERARNAALANAAKRRRLAREENERKAVEGRHEEEARQQRELEARERRRIAEAEELAAAEKKQLETERRQKAKQKRKERRERENAELERLRRQHKEIEQAEKKKLEEAREDKKKRYEQALIDAEAEAEEERARLIHEEMKRRERERELEPPPAPKPPRVEGEPEPEDLMEGMLVTPEEIMEMAMLELRKKAIEQGQIERTRTDSMLLYNKQTGTLGRAVRIEMMIGEPGVAEDIAAIATEIAEEMMGAYPGTLVYVSMLLTEWGPSDGFVGSIDKVVAWGAEGTLIQSWQATYGMKTPESVHRAVISVIRNRMRQNPRAASMIEGILVRGVKPVTVTTTK